jgi:hypothetical protein
MVSENKSLTWLSAEQLVRTSPQITEENTRKRIATHHPSQW